MTYKEANTQLEMYSGIIGKSALNSMEFLDAGKITSLLISPKTKIRHVFSDWWCKGNNNKKAVTKIDTQENFEVFVMSYNPSADAVIYYLRLSKYTQLNS